MTGMIISNKLLRLALFGSWLIGHVAADELKLAGDDARLSGTVRSVRPDGSLELTSELSPEPLVLKSGSVKKIEFTSRTSAEDTASTLVELSNNDLLPAHIESLNADQFTVVSPELGRLEIPRGQVKSLQLGIQRRKVIYEGPKALDEWSQGNDDTKNWTLEDGALVAKGPAMTSKELPLTSQFIMRFTLGWQRGIVPNFKVFFADSFAPKNEASNRYYLQFGSAGMEIKRESAKGKRYHTIAIVNRSAEQFPNQRVRVAIMVNRVTARLQLLINGESEGEFADPIADIPNGRGIVFASNAPDGATQEVRDIEILQYDDSRRRHRSEERGDAASDSLISREDDRWTGRLLEIRPAASGPLFRFKTEFQEQPIEISGKDVSTVFLSGKPEKHVAGGTSPSFILHLAGGGALRASACEFTDESASISHPLLGPLTIRRSGILSLERIAPVAKP